MSNLTDTVGNKSLTNLRDSYEFVDDRFQNSKSALNIKNGNLELQIKNILNDALTIMIWIKLKDLRNQIEENDSKFLSAEYETSPNSIKIFSKCRNKNGVINLNDYNSEENLELLKEKIQNLQMEIQKLNSRQQILIINVSTFNYMMKIMHWFKIMGPIITTHGY